MRAVSRGFLARASMIDRCLAIRPGHRGDYPDQPEYGTTLYTGLHHHTRNIVTAATADAMIVLPGNWGTVQEAAFALDNGTPVALYAAEEHEQFRSGMLLDLGLPELELSTVANWLTALPA